jgi:hypothetical protein
MLTVAVRPRLDLLYDVIQSAVPQFLGARARLEDAMALAEWAARRHPPSVVTVFGPDGATVLEQRTFEGTAVARPTPAAH